MDLDEKMTTVFQSAALRKYSETLLFCGDDYLEMKNAVEGLYRIFASITLIDAYKLDDDHIELATGKAISPSSAAHCLLEFKRTAVFLRGIYNAIVDLKSQTEHRIQILYAGCGPYSTLLLPLLPFFDAEEIGITLVDINEISLNSSRLLIEALEQNAFVDDYLLADLTTLKLDKPYDLVISETMQSCLENEPQIHIMQNLIPQMQEGAIFIPEEIRVDFFLSDNNKFMEKILYENKDKEIVDKKFIGNFICLNKENALSNSFSAIVDIPRDYGTYKDLELFTFITTYKDDVLKERECSLNIPKKFYELNNNVDAKRISFWLTTEGKPIINCRIL